MIIPIDEQPLIALADDDTESARSLLRTLAELGSRRVKWHGDAERSLKLFAESFSDDPARWPSLIVVDLKAAPSANVDFIGALKAMMPEVAAPATAPLVVAMAPNLERETRTRLIDAGAAAVFERHSEPVAYQQEVANLIGFLDRHLAQVSAVAFEIDDGSSAPADLEQRANGFPSLDLEQGTE